MMLPLLISLVFRAEPAFQPAIAAEPRHACFIDAF